MLGDKCVSTFRVDNHDDKKASDVLKRYAKSHPGTKYLVVKEFGEKTNKPHLQGWVVHSETHQAYSRFFARHYSEFKGKGASSGRSFAPRTSDSWFSYIINNSNKPVVRYAETVTNYTEQEFDELKAEKAFVSKQEYAKSQESKQTYRDKVLEALEENCVKDGVIQYDKLLGVYMNHLPMKFGPRDILHNLNGYIARLEYKYPNNTKFRKTMYQRVVELDIEQDGILSKITYDSTMPCKVSKRDYLDFEDTLEDS